jgi:predicted PurR-regulated permease PerM
MQVIIQVLLALLLASAIALLVYLIFVFVKLRALIENLNKTTTLINERLPSILENIERASAQAQSQFELIGNLTQSLQSYLQKFKFAFSGDSPSTDFLPSGLTRVFALIKAIRTVITKLKA